MTKKKGPEWPDFEDEDFDLNRLCDWIETYCEAPISFFGESVFDDEDDFQVIAIVEERIEVDPSGALRLVIYNLEDGTSISRRLLH